MKSVEKINKEETRKSFESFLSMSKEQLDKRFKTSCWDYINKSEVGGIYSIIDFKKYSPMLEVGCGTGRLILPIQDKMEIYGMDFSVSFLEDIKKKTNKITLVEGDAENLPFKSNFFKSVLCVRVIQHLSPKQQQRVINEAARVLVQGGSLIMLNYNSWTLLGVYKIICQTVGKLWPYWPLRKWGWIIDDYNSFPELKRMFKKAGFKITHSRGAVVGEPDVLRFIKISNLLDKYFPPLIKSYYWLCWKIELALKNIFPFKYFMGRVILNGVKK